MRRIVASLPGPYTLLFLPYATYKKHRNAFELDKYPLFKYPLQNADSSDTPADPYDAAYYFRFPLAESAVHLPQARNEMLQVTSPIRAKSLRSRIFNIRSGLAKMPIAQAWSDWDGNDKAPLKRRGKRGPGDGTVPAWSARLIWLEESQIYNTRFAKDHGELPNHPEVHLVLARIIADGTIPKRIRKRPELEHRFGRPAPRKRVETFFEEIAARQIDRTDERFRDPAIWMRVMRDGGFA